MKENDLTILRNKTIFGFYTNIALHNLHITLEHIREICGLKPEMINGKEQDESNLQYWPLVDSLDWCEPDIAKKIVEQIFKHIPFFKYQLEGKNHKEIKHTLKEYIKQVSYLRNHYNHFLTSPLEGSVRTTAISFLDDLFTVARREVKPKYDWIDDEIIETYFFQKIKVKGKIIPNSDFVFKLTDNEKNPKMFEPYGLCFFLGLFLEPKYSNELLMKLLEKSKATDTVKKTACAVFSHFYIRLPKQRIVSSETKHQLLLDILEELKRSPDELYNHISEEDRKLFVNAQASNDFSAELIYKRYKDRFPYLAVKYLEVTKSLPGIQFQNDLGKFYFKNYDKQVDGAIRKRLLAKPLKGFGYPSNFISEKMGEEWQLLVKSTHELNRIEELPEQFISDTKAHYHFTNNQIGIKLLKKPTKPQLHPQYNQMPDLWLSENEIPALLFYLLLSKKSGGKQIEDLLTEFKARIMSFYRDIERGVLIPSKSELELNSKLEKDYNIQFDDISEVFKGYLLPKNIDAESDLMIKLKNTIEATIKETDEWGNRHNANIDAANEKAGTKKHRLIKTAKIAEVMARDFLKFQPTDTNQKGKVNNTLFNVLQARLAIFNETSETLRDLYIECNLVKAANKHPFLDKVPFKNNLSDYYIGYLKERKRFLIRCKSINDLKQLDNPEFYFLRFGKRDIEGSNKGYCQQLAKEFQEKPINIPRGFFLEHIKELINSKNELTILRTFISGKKEANTVFLLAKYLELVEKDAAQPFYDFNRNYFVFDLLNKHPRDKKLKAHYFSTEELEEENTNFKQDLANVEDEEERTSLKRNHVEYQKNEKRLRHIKACDTVLFLMAKQLFSEIDNQVFGTTILNQIKLSEIIPNSETGILSKEIIYPYPIYGKIIQSNLKIKDYGLFRAFLKNPRLENLLTYYPNRVINKTQVEEDLKKFDEFGIKFNRLILSFEESVQKKANPKIEMRGQYVDHKVILEHYFAKESALIPNRNVMMWLRNSFLHNDYPDKSNYRIPNEIKMISRKDKGEKTIAEQLYNLAMKVYPC